LGETGYASYVLARSGLTLLTVSTASLRNLATSPRHDYLAGYLKYVLSMLESVWIFTLRLSNDLDSTFFPHYVVDN
jgi:hypothetical protein